MAITEYDWDELFSGEETRVRKAVERFEAAGELRSLERFRMLNSAYRANELEDLVKLFLFLTTETDLIVHADEFPAEVFRFPKLVSLSLHLESATEIPDLGSLLPKLQYLNLDIPEVRQLPSGMGKLIYLRAFEIARSKLEELDIDFSECRNLARFTVLFSLLKTLPKGLGRLERLHLYGNNELSVTWPEPAMDRLTFLMLSGSKTMHLPATVGYFPVLEHLMMEHTPIQELPVAFASWGESLAIHARGSQFSSLPANLLEANNLALLDIRETPLTATLHASNKTKAAIHAKAQLMKLKKTSDVLF